MKIELTDEEIKTLEESGEVILEKYKLKILRPLTQEEIEILNKESEELINLKNKIDNELKTLKVQKRKIRKSIYAKEFYYFSLGILFTLMVVYLFIG